MAKKKPSKKSAPKNKVTIARKSSDGMNGITVKRVRNV